MTFGLRSEKVGADVVVIAVKGDVDLYTAPELKELLLRKISDGGRRIVVDLTKTTFIDSTALGVLLRAVDRLRASDGHLSVVCADDNITKIFRITGLDRIFPIFKTRSDALASLDGG